MTLLFYSCFPDVHATLNGKGKTENELFKYNIMVSERERVCERGRKKERMSLKKVTMSFVVD